MDVDSPRERAPAQRGSPRSPAPKAFKLSPAKHRTSPTPCTPQKPLWRQRCEEAASRCLFPCCFTLWQSQKGEDRLVVDCHGPSALWAVFDGHRSHDVAGHAAKALPWLLWSSPLWPAKPGEALARALWDCHESARREDLVGGSTAVMVAFAAGQLWCCFAGDSRIVAGLRSGGVRRLSIDHTTSVPEEVARIRASGGSVEWGRLGGCLPMTRGLGNFRLEADGFRCLPEVSVLPVCEAEFVVLASDGLWDVMSDEVCCTLIREWGGVAAGRAADALAAEARARGSTDDIAVVVAYFPLELPPIPAAEFGA